CPWYARGVCGCADAGKVRRSVSQASYVLSLSCARNRVRGGLPLSVRRTTGTGTRPLRNGCNTSTCIHRGADAVCLTCWNIGDDAAWKGARGGCTSRRCRLVETHGTCCRTYPEGILDYGRATPFYIWH